MQVLIAEIDSCNASDIVFKRFPALMKLGRLGEPNPPETVETCTEITSSKPTNGISAAGRCSTLAEPSRFQSNAKWPTSSRSNSKNLSRFLGSRPVRLVETVARLPEGCLYPNNA